MREVAHRASTFAVAATVVLMIPIGYWGRLLGITASTWYQVIEVSALLVTLTLAYFWMGAFAGFFFARKTLLSRAEAVILGAVVSLPIAPLTSLAPQDFGIAGYAMAVGMLVLLCAVGGGVTRPFQVEWLTTRWSGRESAAATPRSQ